MRSGLGYWGLGGKPGGDLDGDVVGVEVLVGDGVLDEEGVGEEGREPGERGGVWTAGVAAGEQSWLGAPDEVQMSSSPRS